jgi:3-deoxy-manno-octulosonate cytidylyltransferase (CMP-KDO synthetase)
MQKTLNVLVLIPARMGSTRFPGKPLALIEGKPMIGHVLERAKAAQGINKVAVATCDAEISEYISSIGGNSIMTSPTHERASDRCAEALGLLESLDQIEYDIVVMAQGDEPLMAPAMLTQVLTPMLTDSTIQITNLMSPINDINSFANPNFVKVVVDNNFDALYFSREPIPSRFQSNDVPMFRQLGIICFRRQALLDYMRLAPSPLEVIESVDMLRVLEHGKKIRMVETLHQSQSVDTPEDLALVENLIRQSIPVD